MSCQKLFSEPRFRLALGWTVMWICFSVVDCPGLAGQEQKETGGSVKSQEKQDGLPGTPATSGTASNQAKQDLENAAAQQRGDDEGFVALFDGQTLDGWINPYEWGEVAVVDGEIHLTADRKFFLVTEKEFADFELQAEICLPAEGKANSGLMFRCHVEPNRVFGYQAECDPGERAWTGGLYDEGRRAWLSPRQGDEGKVKLVQAPMGEWIRYRVICRGDQLQIYVNDELITEFQDDVDAAGHIGIQHHGEQGQTYRFRNIRLKVLESDAADANKASGSAVTGSGGSEKEQAKENAVEKDKARDGGKSGGGKPNPGAANG